MLTKFWEKWSHMPWFPFKSPFEQWKVLPTFLIGEYMVILLTLLMIRHAFKQGRIHLIVVIAAFCTGAANDIFFMALPLVDNFWQAQATIMITPRLPLYIPCVYTVFLYTACMSSWRLRLPPLAEAAVAGLLGEMIYSVYDIVGIKFLWWTWHDTDPPIAVRLLGVPVGSSLWVVTFTGTFTLVLRFVLLNRTRTNVILTLLTSALVTTPLMMVQMSLLQLLSGDIQGKPTLRSMGLGVGIYATWALYSILRSSFNQRIHPSVAFVKSKLDQAPRIALLLYFLTFNLIMALGHPENHVSTGVHQTIGPCNVSEIDLTGLSREKYLCPAHHQQDWDFRCAPGGKAPEGLVEWYTVCGLPHKDFRLWQFVEVALSLLGALTFLNVLQFVPSKKKN